MNWREYIETNDNILVGKPVVKGTRISVEHVIKLLASGWSKQQILDNYPRLSPEALKAIFVYVHDCMRDGLMFNDPLKSA
ncbi:MAG: DUF433 domain-containing protein [Bacteroidota bacterium]